MKHLTFIIAIFILSLQPDNAQLTFEKEYSGTGFQKINDLIKTPGGYVITGATSASGMGQKDMMISMIDTNGNSVWGNTVGGSGNDEAFSAAYSADGFFVFTGYTTNYNLFPNDSFNIFLAKTDTTGNFWWSRVYGSNGKEVARRIIQTKNHDYLIAGTRIPVGSTYGHVFILETDSDGNYKWSTTFGAGGGEIVNDVIETTNGYIILGNTTNFNGQLIFATKIDTAGNIEWTKTYDFTGTYNPKQFDGRKIIRGYNHDFVFTGTRGLGSIGDAQPYLTSIDSLGNVNWSIAYTLFSGAAYGCAVDKTVDGGFIIGGEFGTTYALLIKTLANGNGVWSYYYSPPNAAYNNGKIFSTVSCDDGGFLSAGWKYKNNDTSGYLFKTLPGGIVNCTFSTTFSMIPAAATLNASAQTFTIDTATIARLDSGTAFDIVFNFTTYCSTQGVEDLNSNKVISCYPNPFENQVTFETSFDDRSELFIYDLAGRLLKQELFIKNITLKTDNIPGGIYLYEIRSEKGKSYRGELVRY